MLSAGFLAAPLYAQESVPTLGGQLGELVITGDKEDHRPRLALLPSLSPDLEDVIVRGIVRHNLELSGLYRIIDDAKAPPGSYGFTDPVDVPAWKKLGAEVVVKLAARRTAGARVEVIGLAYLISTGERPLYHKRITVHRDDVRVTAHRITDALLGALTGREGGFASRLTFASRWGRNSVIFTMDGDGHSLTRRTNPQDTSISAAWGPGGYLFYTQSRDYLPFKMMRLGEKRPLALPFDGAVYSVAYSPDGKRMALSVSEGFGSKIYEGNSDGTQLTVVSDTEISTHPAFSPSGKLAWIGGGPKHGSQRVYLEGRAVSVAGVSAASPTFCDTEDGIRLVYSVSVGGDRRDLVWSSESGKGLARLTQNVGSNTYPACSPDGRMIAFFSDRSKGEGLYVKSLKTYQSQKISGRVGQSLRWARIPGVGHPDPLVSATQK